MPAFSLRMISRTVLISVLPFRREMGSKYRLINLEASPARKICSLATKYSRSLKLRWISTASRSALWLAITRQGPCISGAGSALMLNRHLK